MNERIRVVLGHPGGTLKAKVIWSEHLGVWMHYGTIPEKRYWHAFGVGRPDRASPVSIDCEINFPVEGIDRRIGGALARDGEGRVCVVHRGKIGGGKKGIGKSVFEEHYRGVWAPMEDGDTVSTVVIIGFLENPRFARQVTHFVRKVNRIKHHVSLRSSQLEIGFDERSFREEFVGERFPGMKYDVSGLCDYPLIVQDLRTLFEKKRYRVGNDHEREFFIASEDGTIKVLFRVITDTSPEQVRAGVAHLFLAAATLSEKPKMVLITPGALSEDMVAKLKKLGIAFLTYTWHGEQAVFPDLPSLVCEWERGVT